MSGRNELKSVRERTERDLERVLECVQNAPGQVAPLCGRWKLLDVVEQEGNPGIRALTGEDGTPLAETWRNPDGSVQIELWGKPQERLEIRIRSQDMEDQFMHWAASQVVEHVHRQTGQALITALGTDGNSSRPGSLTGAIDNAAGELAARVTMPGTEARASLPGLGEKLSDLIEDRLADPWAMETSRRWYRYNHTTRWQGSLVRHNSLAVNQKVFRKLIQSSPNTFRYYLHYVLVHMQTHQVFQHPGEVVTLVREHTGFTPAEWKQFCRIPGPTKASSAGWENTPRDIADGCRLLAAVNRPRASRPNLAAVMEMGHRTRIFQDGGPHAHPRRRPYGQQDQGAPWTAWVRTVNRFLDARDGLPRNRTALYRVADTLEGHVENNLPWEPGSWRAMVARSDRWHTEMLERNTLQAYPGAREATWDSPLGETRVGEFTASPVTTGQELLSLGASMRNCLGSYWDKCAEGQLLIFTISLQGEISAAAELRNEDGEWRLGQVEAPGRKRLAAGAVEAARTLAERCNQTENG